MDVKTHYCSFCGESEHDLKALIKGPSALICDACVALCGTARGQGPLAASSLWFWSFRIQSGGGRVMRNYRKPEMYSDADWEMVRATWPARMACAPNGPRQPTCTVIAMGFRTGLAFLTNAPRFFVAVRR